MPGFTPVSLSLHIDSCSLKQEGGLIKGKKVSTLSLKRAKRGKETAEVEVEKENVPVPDISCTTVPAISCNTVPANQTTNAKEKPQVKQIRQVVEVIDVDEIVSDHDDQLPLQR